MPLFSVPDSFGTTPLTEYNHCHNPDGTGGGQFCSTEHDRAIYGATEDDPETLTPKTGEVDTLDNELESDEDAGDLKDEIAGDLDTAWNDLEDDFNTLADDISDEVNDHVNTIGHGGSGGGGETDYSGYEEEYEQYKTEQVETIDEEFRNEQYKEYAREKADYIEEMQTNAKDLETVWAQERQKLIDSGEYAYGDLDHGQNPLLLDVAPPPTGGDEWLKDAFGQGETVRFDPKDKVLDPRDVLDELDITNKDSVTTDENSRAMDETDDSLREYIRTQIRGGYNLGEMTDEAAVRGHEYFRSDDDEGSTDYDAFEHWRENEGGEADYDSIDNYETWAENQGYGSTNGDEGGGVDGSDYSREKAVASYLIHKWADTSGDSDKMAVAMQIAASKKFGIENPYFERMHENAGQFAEAERFYAKHGPALDAFLVRMHENTQSFLRDTPGEYVTLYRGFSLLTSPKDEPGVSTVDFKNGTLVDVNLQPMSSFSTSFPTAKNFSHHGTYRGESQPVVMAIRVPKKAVIGSFRTGFGCSGEFEVVILGGRRPAVVLDGNAIHGQMAIVLGRIAQQYEGKRKKTGQDATPLPGERF